MSNKSSNNKRIAKNTLMLYLRMLLIIIVQLYTVPVVLRNLGVEDYGIYNVVGGIVTLFTFVSASLSSGTQRFIAYAIGKRDSEQVQTVFRNTLTIYLIFATVMLVFFEIGGTWFLNTQMNIAQERMFAANCVFQLSLLSFVVSLLYVPFNSMIIANEHMSVYAYVSILDVNLKLLVAFLLSISNGDKLIIYAVMLCFVSVLIGLVYVIYSRRKFKECQDIKFNIDKKLGKELLIYSGWNVIGAIAIITRNQGINIVVNLFFGPLLNAAHAIGQQISGVLTQFINNVYMATRPQITKLYAQNELHSMWRLTYQSNKLAYYLLLLIAVPAMIELPKVLELWLKTVPNNTVLIARFLIITLLVETLTNQLIGVFQAANKIKFYQIYSSTVLLLNIPVTYCLLKFFSANPAIPYVTSTVLSVAYIASIVFIAKREIALNIKEYTNLVILPSVTVTVLSVIVVYFMSTLLQPSLLRVLYTICVSLIITLSIVWTIGLKQEERRLVIDLIKKKIHK